MGDIRRFDVGTRMSEAAVHNGVVWCAGQVAWRDTVPDIEGQTKEVLAAVDKLLAENGSNKRRLLMVSVFLTDMALFERFNAVYDAWLADSKGHAPPRATTQARLGDDKWLIEIVAQAAVDPRAKL